MATVKHPCWESYCRIADKAKVALRRVLHRVFRPRPHRLHTMMVGCSPPPSRGLIPLRLYNFLS
jgi:hypothetical protein